MTQVMSKLALNGYWRYLDCAHACGTSRAGLTNLLSTDTGRFLAVYMLLMPLGLYGELDMSLTVIPASVVMSVFLFGIEELGIQVCGRYELDHSPTPVALSVCPVVVSALFGIGKYGIHVCDRYKLDCDLVCPFLYVCDFEIKETGMHACCRHELDHDDCLNHHVCLPVRNRPIRYTGPVLK